MKEPKKITPAACRRIFTHLGIALALALLFTGCETTKTAATSAGEKPPAAASRRNDDKVRLAPESRIAVGTVIDREIALDKNDPLSPQRSRTAMSASGLGGAVGGTDVVRAGVLLGTLAGAAMLDEMSDTEITYTIRLRDGRVVRRNFIEDPKFRVGEDVVVHFDQKGKVKRVAVMREAGASAGSSS